VGVCKKKKSAEQEEIGRKWIWTGLDTSTRLLVCFLIGDRSLEDAHSFLEDLVSRIVGLPLFVSDELPHYSDGLKELFHHCIEQEPTGRRGRPRKPEKVVDAELDYATVHKTRDRGRVVKVETKIVFGSEERIEKKKKALPGKTINTSYVERSNLNWRLWDAHLTRKSLTFAKASRWLNAKFSICVAFYNFIRPHETLSRAEDRTFKPKTPAMAAKITNQLWSTKDLLGHKVFVN
jgi:IS1 family transposase